MQRSDAMTAISNDLGTTGREEGTGRGPPPRLEGLEGRLLLYSDDRPVDLLQPDHLQLHARRHQRRRRPQRPVPDPQRRRPHRHLAGPDRAGRHPLGGQRQPQPRPGPRRRPARRLQRQPAGRPPLRRHPHRRHPAPLRRPRRDLPPAADQRRHRRRRHPLQLHRPVADRHRLRPRRPSPPTSSATPWASASRPSPTR